MAAVEPLRVKVFSMEVTIKIPDELAIQARARGVPVATYIEALLADQVTDPTAKKQALRTQAEIRAWIDSLAQFSDKIPQLPETISREWIYQDRD